MSEPLRALIADDHPLFRLGLRYALGAQGFEVVAEAEDGQKALIECAAFQPDVALIDVKMPGLDGIETCRRLREAQPGVLAVMLTTFDEPAIVQAANEAGASGYLSKEASPAELARMLENITRHPERNWLPPVRLPPLTSREMQVLRLLAGGGSNKAIAKALTLSPETVKSYLDSIYGKLEVRDRLSALRRAQELGLVA